MKSEAFEAWCADNLPKGAQTNVREAMERGESVSWLIWQAATQRAAQAALSAPVKTDRQDQREACAAAIMKNENDKFNARL